MSATFDSSQASHVSLDQVKKLIFNGRTFAPLGAVPSAEYSGYFEACNAGIHLYRPSGEVEAYLVANPSQGYFAVSAFTRDKRVWYMQACTAQTESWLGIENLSMADEREMILAAFQQVQ